MTRAAFKMKLKNASFIDEYKRRHDEIWPELRVLLTEAGVSDYSIFFDQETLTLFAVQKVSGDGGSQDLGRNPIVRKWWDYMADIMETEEDNAPVSIPLPEVFHLE
ncbi:MAG: L-rhamnose mutarotase [Spirochaetaceae bacterium]|nr:L-rhamnose mutarotase [Spirochaetaceae bacterium]MDT8298975.1 L-rhamnose mutarotase [Spirochaetaceae bacterium]